MPLDLPLPLHSARAYLCACQHIVRWPFQNVEILQCVINQKPKIGALTKQPNENNLQHGKEL